MKVTIIGCGRWGTFLGWYSQKIGNEVLIWGRESSKKLDNLKKNRKNEYLVINNDIILSSSMEKAISFGDVIIISVSSQYLRDVCKQMNNFDLNGGESARLVCPRCHSERFWEDGKRKVKDG